MAWQDAMVNGSIFLFILEHHGRRSLSLAAVPSGVASEKEGDIDRGVCRGEDTRSGGEVVGNDEGPHSPRRVPLGGGIVFLLFEF